MMNKKIVAILMSTLAISSISARFCRDEYGNRVSCTGKVVAGAGEAAGDVVETLNPFNWGSGGAARREAREARREAEEARREAREARDDAREARDEIDRE